MQFGSHKLDTMISRPQRFWVSTKTELCLDYSIFQHQKVGKHRPKLNHPYMPNEIFIIYFGSNMGQWGLITKLRPIVNLISDQLIYAWIHKHKSKYQNNHKQPKHREVHTNKKEANTRPKKKKLSRTYDTN